jgi:hypothetical protein
MKSTELPALIELRESLREAAARDVAARKPRRRRRRGIGILAAVLVTGAAAAGAADLISSGEPVNDEHVAATRYSSDGQLRIDTKADDTPLPWGVQPYTSKDGQVCALAGRIRGGVQLGLLDAKGVFHKYGEGRSGACGSITNKAGGFISGLRREGRTVLYGRAQPGATVHVVVDGVDTPAPTGRDGSFVFVFKGSAEPSDVRYR